MNIYNLLVEGTRKLNFRLCLNLAPRSKTACEKASKAQLRELNEVLENYFANTIIPHLFVDADLILRKFTPPAMKLFILTNADINRHIHYLVDNIKYPNLIENITEVIKSSKHLKRRCRQLITAGSG